MRMQVELTVCFLKRRWKINKIDRCVIKKRKINPAECENGNSVLGISTSKDFYEAVSGTALPEILFNCQAWTLTVTAKSAEIKVKGKTNYKNT